MQKGTDLETRHWTDVCHQIYAHICLTITDSPHCILATRRGISKTILQIATVQFVSKCSSKQSVYSIVTLFINSKVKPNHP